MGTLTEAAGAVDRRDRGHRLHLAFRLKSGGPPSNNGCILADGRARTTCSMGAELGETVAVLSEDIRRIG